MATILPTTTTVQTSTGARTAAVAVLAAATAIALPGCAGNSDDDRPAARTPASDREAALGDRHEIVARYGKPASRAPRARIPAGPPPGRLAVKDLRAGDGPAVQAGEETIVNYVGYRHSTRERYDSSYRSNPRPYRVVPGRGDFIAGFEEAIVGMRTGGLRQATIPPDKAYGDRGYGNQIDPGETLVFVIELEAHQPSANPPQEDRR